MKNTKQIFENKTNYLDILFADRNKLYGAYELRNNYNKRIFTALGFIIIAGCLSSVLAGKGAKPVIPPQRYDALVITAFRPLPTEKPKTQTPNKVKQTTSKGLTASRVKTRSNNFKIAEKDADIKPLENMDADTKLGPKDNTNINANAKDLIGEGGRNTNLTDKFPGVASDDNKGLGKQKETTDDKKVHTEFTVDHEPIFPGGKSGMEKFLMENLVYPMANLEKDQVGKVVIQFVVDEKGNISEVKVANKAYAEMDIEAMRVVKKMPNWKPAIFQGQAVSCLFEMPITFELD
jgi:periplasmic protein TonB